MLEIGGLGAEREQRSRYSVLISQQVRKRGVHAATAPELRAAPRQLFPHVHVVTRRRTRHACSGITALPGCSGPAPPCPTPPGASTNSSSHSSHSSPADAAVAKCPIRSQGRKAAPGRAADAFPVIGVTLAQRLRTPALPLLLAMMALAKKKALPQEHSRLRFHLSSPADVCLLKGRLALQKSFGRIHNFSIGVSSIKCALHNTYTINRVFIISFMSLLGAFTLARSLSNIL